MPLIERRYAEALVELAGQQGAMDEFQNQFCSVVDLYEYQQDFRNFLLNPEIRVEGKKDIVRRILDGNIRTEMLNFLLLLLDKGRIEFLPGILLEYIKLADSRRNVLHMTIISSDVLDAKQVEELKEKYKKVYNASSVDAKVEIDKKVIGGIKVQIGDKVIDGTVRGRLENLKKILVES